MRRLKTPYPAYGGVVSEVGTVKDGIVFLNVTSLKNGVTLSAPLNDDGSWYIDLSSLRLTDGRSGTGYLSEDKGTEQLYCMAGKYGDSSVVDILMREDAPANPVYLEDINSNNDSNNSLSNLVSQVYADVTCGGGCCPNGWCYGGGTSSHESCEARASEACIGHGGIQESPVSTPPASTPPVSTPSGCSDWPITGPYCPDDDKCPCVRTNCPGGDRPVCGAGSSDCICASQVTTCCCGGVTKTGRDCAGRNCEGVRVLQYLQQMYHVVVMGRQSMDRIV